MSKIIQFSTIGALMSGYLEGEGDIHALCRSQTFGLGCSEAINGELTVFKGAVWEATAGESLSRLGNSRVPFLQVTEFNAESSADVRDITLENAEQQLAARLPIQNIFVAVCIEARFDSIKIRRPQPAKGGERDISEVADAQQEDTLSDVQGRVIGFWTPELFGRISVPGFHFHFIDEAQQVSGHVLSFHATKARLSYEQKQTIEITNPNTQHYKSLEIDIASLDKLIAKVEK